MSNSLRSALRGSGTPRPSRGDEVYAKLRKELLSGNLTPWERLAEERLAEAYQVSRTPVREALARLQADGLIEKRDGGLYLYLPTFEELINLYELRITLELQGIRRIKDDPTLHHDTDLLDAELGFWADLVDNRPALDTAFVTSDERFHIKLLTSSGNSSLTEALTQVNQRIRPVRMNDYLTDDRMTATITEHIAILELVLKKKLSAAMDALSDHVGVSRDVVIDRAEQALSMQQRRSQE